MHEDDDDDDDDYESGEDGAPVMTIMIFHFLGYISALAWMGLGGERTDPEEGEVIVSNDWFWATFLYLRYFYGELLMQTLLSSAWRWSGIQKLAEQWLRFIRKRTANPTKFSNELPEISDVC